MTDMEMMKAPSPHPGSLIVSRKSLEERCFMQVVPGNRQRRRCSGGFERAGWSPAEVDGPGLLLLSRLGPHMLQTEVASPLKGLHADEVVHRAIPEGSASHLLGAGEA